MSVHLCAWVFEFYVFCYKVINSILSLQKCPMEVGMVGCDPRTLEAKAGRSKVQGQSEYIEKLWLIEVEKRRNGLCGWMLNCIATFT